ncbi:response regulator [Aquincola tertiaricarbonis]|uniref:histidine kinase n=1 Tax=Aquincola tertiaricarbonis TaxID=391953 RepID=A0ABY4S4Z3_AQUTE|nr:response regulator [Aquincola tertiaricarbonis]URI07082.1 response regulator [Aquincola tertiaricarbonis]
MSNKNHHKAWIAASLTGALALMASVWWAQRSFGDGFLPHGFCLTWIPGLLWLHVASDTLIALAYLSIPITLLYFVRRRPDLPFGPMYLLFGAFIVACGITHLMDVWTLWNPDYWLAGGIKAVTAAVSVTTAFALVAALPRALTLPSVQQLEKAKAALEDEVRARCQAEAELRRIQAELEQRVAQRTAALAEATALLDGLFDAVPTGIAVFDDADRYVRVNPALGRINGAPTADHAGRSLADMVPTLADEVGGHLATVRRTGQPLLGLEVSGHVPGRAGLSSYAVSYFPVAGAGGTVHVGAICEDITERRAAEAERVHLLQEAQEANRLKGEFVAHVSHELRTPLQALLSWVGLLKSGKLDAKATARAFERLEHNVQLQSRMIAELLGAARSPGLDVAEAARVAGAQASATPPTLAANSTTMAATPARPTAESNDQPLLDLRILYVEDEPDVAEATAQALGALGARVALAPAPDAAAELLRSAAFDVLVSDLRLADGATGFDVLERVRQLDRRLPAIALSAYGSERDLAATSQAGFVHHLVKPVDAQTLASAVLKVLQGRAAAG